ncbi:putative nucleic acid-binding Zn-ribbon protein [Bradyrhizobium sp. GM7.3]
MSEQEAIEELKRIRDFLAQNPPSELIELLQAEFTGFTTEFADLPEEISLLTSRVSEFSHEAKDSLEQIEQSISEHWKDNLTAVLAELQHELGAEANQLAEALKIGFDETRVHSVSAIDTMSKSLNHSIDHLIDEVHDITRLFTEVRSEIANSLDTLANARKAVLGLTSPLRETSEVVGDALKIATEIFEGVG